MKTTTVTIKGLANSEIFNENVEKYKKENLDGYHRLSTFDNLKGKNAQHKVVLKARYWLNSWSGFVSRVYETYYK